jgi:hypothetical protein
MKRSPPLEANSRSVSPEIPCLSWDLKVHYHFHNSPPMVPILSQMKSIHTLIHYFFMIYFNIGLQAASSLQISRLKFCMNFSALLCVLHTPSISSTIIHTNGINRIYIYALVGVFGGSSLMNKFLLVYKYQNGS